MKIVVIGGVAAGTKVAAKLMREDRNNEVTVLNKGEYISYAGCGLPYYVGHVIEEKAQLIVNTPEKFEGLTGAKVLNQVEATKIDREAKTVTATNLVTGEENTYNYDKLVIAAGASPVKLPIEGLDLENVFYMRTPDDAYTLRDAVATGNIKKAVVVGAGYIGLEVAENLAANGVKPFVVDMATNILPGFDAEMSSYIEKSLTESGIPVVTGVAVTAILGDGKVEKVTTTKRAFKADAVVLSAGIAPNTKFLADSGLEMFKGTLITNEQGQTNDKDIYSVGDCAMVRNAITGKPAWSPMGSTANINGRIVAQAIMGKEMSYRGVLGTAVCKLPATNAGRTGLTVEQAKAEGFDPISVVTIVDDKAHYMADSSIMAIKLIADKNTQQLLGVQAVGKGCVDKIVDIAVTAIMCKAKLADIADMDLAYAPPFSTAIHPFAHTLNVLMNKLNGNFTSMTPAEYLENGNGDYTLIDASLAPTTENAEYIDLVTVIAPLANHALDEKLLLVCNKGKRAYLLQNRLKAMGYTNTIVLEGGNMFSDVEA